MSDRSLSSLMGSTVRTKSAECMMLADRRGTLPSGRIRARSDPGTRPFRSKTIGHPVQTGEASGTAHVVLGNTVVVPITRDGRASTDRLVAALVVMIQQADRNRRDGAGTLASSSGLEIG